MRECILVVEDDAAINDLICMSLEAAGYRTRPFFDGDRVFEFLVEDCGEEFGLALVDVMIPGRDGFELLPEFKERGIPVIYLTAKGDVTSKIKGLKSGAEDYVVKPFEMLELLVRIEKVLDRFGKGTEEIRIGDVVIYPLMRKVLKGGEEVPLKPMEFDCLLLFVKNKNIALTREQLLHSLWGVEFDGETRTIDVHVGRIRKKLGWQEVIRTIPRIGYRLEVDA
ncbi:MAG TPA: response regulator transcription factor [Candidatus Pelethocola excrementipullorum]|nr:response regulator transcription factor [Candidatus Pelethocola excrementipullorum]